MHDEYNEGWWYNPCIDLMDRNLSPTYRTIPSSNADRFSAVCIVAVSMYYGLAVQYKKKKSVQEQDV
jgi:hypothetical protein